ncbi:MAG: hypothetical protein NZ839_03345, partial [Endomicrobia bacterium]|nr:hypothetical protein [Endomicrobiia bacterium]
KLTLSLPAGIVSNNIAIDNSPLPPTNFSALQIETNKILLSWTKSIDDGSGNNDVLFYNIYRSTDNKKFFVVAKVVSGNTYYIDIVDMLGTTYYYKITAEDKNSSSLASLVQKVFVPLITKPQPPTNVNVAIFQHYISSADVILSWSASVDESTNVAKYKVFKSTRSDMFNFIFEIIKTGNTNYYFIDRCIANNTYFYIVISENSYGKTSDTSTVVSIFIPAIMPPQPPRNLTAFDTPEDLGGNITLCWQPSVDENSVVSPVIEYRIYKSSDGNNFVVFYRYNNLGKTSYTFYDTECLTGVTFYYYITAVNNFGLESAHSNVVSAFSIKNTEIIDNTPPEIPSYVAAMDYPNDDGSKILILWSLSKDDGMGDNDVVKYKIYRNYSYLTYLPAGTTWFIDNTVLPNITYFYYLTVLDKNNNESGGTAIISCTALADGIPAKVENFTAEVKSHYSGVYVVLRWDKSADDTTGWNDVDMYIIYRATDNINYTTVISLPKGVTFYIDTNCEVNTKYYYKLIVKDKSGLTSPAVDVDVFTMYKILLLPGEKVVLKYKYLDEQLILLFSQLSLNQTVEVEIKTKDNFINMSNEMNITPVTSVYEIKTKPNKVKFNVPVKIQLYYNQQKLQNINEERLRLFLYDETLTKWLMLNNSKVVLNENYVEAEVYNFSCFVAGVYKYEYEKFFKEEHVYATPSPARGDEVKFKFIVYQPVKVKVYVYDISGDFVWQSEEKEFTQQDVGKLHEIKWNIKNVATGLYVFRIEGKQFGKKQNVIKKVAIIH